MTYTITPVNDNTLHYVAVVVVFFTSLSLVLTLCMTVQSLTSFLHSGDTWFSTR